MSARRSLSGCGLLRSLRPGQRPPGDLKILREPAARSPHHRPGYSGARAALVAEAGPVAYAARASGRE